PFDPLEIIVKQFVTGIQKIIFQIVGVYKNGFGIDRSHFSSSFSPAIFNELCTIIVFEGGYSQCGTYIEQIVVVGTKSYARFRSVSRGSALIVLIFGTILHRQWKILTVFGGWILFDNIRVEIEVFFKI